MPDKKKGFQLTETELSQKSDVLAEEFPEGSYGSPLEESKLGKTTEWEAGQHMTPQFSFENRTFHAGLKRAFPDVHPTHSETEESP